MHTSVLWVSDKHISDVFLSSVNIPIYHYKFPFFFLPSTFVLEIANTLMTIALG